MREQPSSPRPRLTRAVLTSTAVALADEAGLEGLAMRAIAERLEVVPMALYKHVANKEALLDDMVDAVWSEVQAPDPALGWREAMRVRAVSLRAALRRHRWAVGLMESRLRPGPANLRQHDAMMGCLRRSGFSFRTTVHVTSALDAYVYGFALQEKTLPFDTPEESAEVVAEKQAALADAASAFPYLVEVAVELQRAGYDADAEFEVGLDLLLDGVEQLRPGWIIETSNG